MRPNTLQSIAVLLVLALVMRQGLLVLVCTLLLLTAGLAALWNRWSLRRLNYERLISSGRAFPDDKITLQLRLSNRKPLPLTSVNVRDRMPPGLHISGSHVQLDHHGKQVVDRGTSLRWYEQVTWNYQVHCDRRGAYRFGPATLDSGDPFGFYTTERAEPQTLSLIVYPRLLPLERLRLPQRRPLGELRAPNIVRDPMRTIGVRDYHTSDPLRHVHWTATARTGTLQTRVYEPTGALELVLFLDLDSFEQYWQGVDDEQIERMISATATVAKAAIDEGYAVGLYVNGAPAQFEQLVRLPPSRSAAQFERIMETLARLVAFSVAPMARVLRLHARELPAGATLMLISCIAPESTRAVLARIRAAGRPVWWLFLGDDVPPAVPGVVVHHAPTRQDWRRGPAEVRL